ncbi:MAG: DNA-processing protein DprA [Saprospiraceae bacterium]|nr:DNA-processing protein DprA [Saprospiraceae bacterium]
MKHLLEKLALSLLDGVGPIMARQLVAYIGDVAEIFKTRKKELLAIPGIGEKTVQVILHHKEIFKRAEEELVFIEKHEVRPLFFIDKGYPFRLKAYEDSPIMLYYKGAADLDHHRIVSIIGTRSPTEGGKLLCEKLIEELFEYQVVVVSGLAYGVDITAHRKCLEMDIPTIGVMGNGLDKLYPSAHLPVSKKMIEKGGLMTQFITRTRPDRENFPMRNKVVAGMSDAIVVVESGQEGGSMITAEYGNLYNKDVFAFPGRTTDSQSAGCNQLIKRHKAALIENGHDLALSMNWEKSTLQTIQRSLFVELNESEQLVITLLKQQEYLSIDRMYQEIKQSPSEIAGLLLELEFKGVIKALPGKKYMLIN